MIFNYIYDEHVAETWNTIFGFKISCAFCGCLAQTFFGRTPIFFTVTSPYFQPPPLEYPLLAQMALLRAGLLVVLFVAAVAAKEGCEAEDEALLQVPCNRKNRRSNLVGLFHFGWILCFLHKGRVSNTCMQHVVPGTARLDKSYQQDLLPTLCLEFLRQSKKWISVGLSRFNCPSKMNWSFWVRLGPRSGESIVFALPCIAVVATFGMNVVGSL